MIKVEITWKDQRDGEITGETIEFKDVDKATENEIVHAALALVAVDKLHTSDALNDFLEKNFEKEVMKMAGRLTLMNIPGVRDTGGITVGKLKELIASGKLPPEMLLSILMGGHQLGDEEGGPRTVGFARVHKKKSEVNDKTETEEESDNKESETPTRKEFKGDSI